MGEILQPLSQVQSQLCDLNFLSIKFGASLGKTRGIVGVALSKRMAEMRR